MRDLPANQFEGKPCRKCGSTVRYRTAKACGRCAACLLTSSLKSAADKRAAARSIPGKTFEAPPCPKCGGTSRYVLTHKCVICQKAAAKRSQDKHREKYKERYRGRYKDQIYNRPVTHQKLGISLEMFNALKEKQGGVCAICKGKAIFPKRALHVDHCHQTGVFRGLLCGHCNTGLGMFKDNTQFLRKAIEYLENNGWSL